MLDGGERIVKEEQNRDLKGFLKKANDPNAQAGSVGGDVHFHVNALDTNGFDRWYNSNRNRIQRDTQQRRRV